MIARLLPFALLGLVACADVPDAALRQLESYKAATTPLARVAGETGEGIDCAAAHPVCADLWLARAEALSALASPGVPADRRLARAAAAAEAAGRATAALPPGARPDLALRALKVRVAAVRTTRDLAAHPSDAARADADLAGLAAEIRALPDGAPVAAWVATEAAMAATLRTTAAAAIPCTTLLALRAGLPADPPPDLAAPVMRADLALDGLVAAAGCRP